MTDKNEWAYLLELDLGDIVHAPELPKLRPCPFCDSEAVENRRAMTQQCNIWLAVCTGCGAIKGATSNSACIAGWNDRKWAPRYMDGL